MKHIRKITEAFRGSKILDRIHNIDNSKVFIEKFKQLLHSSGYESSKITDNEISYLGYYELKEELRNIDFNNKEVEYIVFLFSKNKNTKSMQLISRYRIDEINSCDFEYALLVKLDTKNKTLKVKQKDREINTPLYISKDGRDEYNNMYRTANFEKYLNRLVNSNKDVFNQVIELLKGVSTKKAYFVILSLSKIMDKLFYSIIDDEFDEEEFTEELKSVYKLIYFRNIDLKKRYLTIYNVEESDMEDDFKLLLSNLEQLNILSKKFIESLDYTNVTKFVFELNSKLLLLNKNYNSQINNFIDNDSSYRFSSIILQSTNINNNLDKHIKILNKLIS